MEELIKKIKKDLRISPDSIHAETHWDSVAAFGKYIAEKENLNKRLIKLFAYFHDSKRHNNSHDPEHGPRAAEFVKTFTLEELGLTEKERDQLVFACRYHTYEKETDNKDILACWDADRLDLPRAGITVDIDRLFTEAAKTIVLDKIRNIGIRPPKDVDSAGRTLFYKIYFKFFFPIFLLSFFALGFFGGILVAGFISLLLTLFVLFVADGFSNVATILYGGRQNIITTREQMQSTLKTVRYAKMIKDYKKAIDIVNTILLQDPKFYEAMLVKAQILYEGFNNIDAAKKYLNKVINNTQPDERVHIWASTFNKQIKSNGTLRKL